jgi:hypothetical protein
MEEAHQQQLEALQQQWLAAKAAAQQRNDEATAAARARCGHALWSLFLFMQRISVTACPRMMSVLCPHLHKHQASDDDVGP